MIQVKISWAMCLQVDWVVANVSSQIYFKKQIIMTMFRFDD